MHHTNNLIVTSHEIVDPFAPLSHAVSDAVAYLQTVVNGVPPFDELRVAECHYLIDAAIRMAQIQANVPPPTFQFKDDSF